MFTTFNFLAYACCQAGPGFIDILLATLGGVCCYTIPYLPLHKSFPTMRAYLVALGCIEKDEDEAKGTLKCHMK